MATFTYDDPNSPFPTAIDTDRLSLVRFDRADLDLRTVHDRLTSEGVRAAMSVPSYPFDPPETAGDTREFLERYLEPDDRAFFAAAVDDDPTPLAGVALFDPEWETRCGEGGMWLDREHWGKGYVAETGRAFFELAFTHLDLDRFVALAAARNDRARRCVEGYLVEAGGQLDGVWRGEHYNPSDGTVEDTARYSITEAEWRDGRAD